MLASAVTRSLSRVLSIAQASSAGVRKPQANPGALRVGARFAGTTQCYHYGALP